MTGTTWSVRMDEETKKEITELLGSNGGNGEEFIKNLISSYKLKQAEESQPLAAQDLKDLQIHLSGIQDIYYNLTKRVDTRLIAKDKEIETAIAQKDEVLKNNTEEINKIQLDMIDLELALKTSSEENKNNIKTIEWKNKKISELEDTVNTTKALVSEYKEKNDTLAGLLAEYKGYKSEIEEMKKSLVKEQELRAALEKEKNDITDQFERSKMQYDEDIKKINSSHDEDIKKIKNNLDMDHKQNLLDIQSVHQNEVNKLHKEYNDQIQSILMNFNKNNEEPKKQRAKGKAEPKSSTVSE